MTDTWANESALDHAREVLAERFPGETVEIIETFDTAYVGWECDYQGALIKRDGVPEIVIVDETSGDGRPVAVKMRERIDQYRNLIVDTERVLRRHADLLLSHVYEDLDKLDRPNDDEPPDRVVWRHSDGTLYRLRRRPGESDRDFADRERRISMLRNLVLPPDSQDAAAAIARLGLERIEDDE